MKSKWYVSFLGLIYGVVISCSLSNRLTRSIPLLTWPLFNAVAPQNICLVRRQKLHHTDGIGPLVRIQTINHQNDSGLIN